MKSNSSRKRFTPGKAGSGKRSPEKFTGRKNDQSGKKKTAGWNDHGDRHAKNPERDLPKRSGPPPQSNKPDASIPPFGERRKQPVKHTRLKPGEGKSKLPKYDPARQKEHPVPRGEEMPLNKYIAHCGICSRRKAVDYIKEGKVTVNGNPVTEPAFKVTKNDAIQLGGRKISLQQNSIYVLLNKPKGFITTTDDPEGRRTVMELVQDAADERIFPVGRLDRNTSGLLLLTNDGELAQKLSHPKHNTKKVYHVELDKPLTKADFEKISHGVELEDGIAHVDALAYADDRDKSQVGIEIHSGKNRIVRRIFEELGYQVEKLDRVLYAGLTKKNIPRGKWRFLTEKEVVLLKHFK